VALADRARAIIAQPAQEWNVIAAEPATTTEILRGYVVPLALIGPIFTLAGSLLFAQRGFAYACAAAVLEFILEIVAVFVVAFLADALGPSFGGTKDQVPAFKWIAYASTPRWLAGIFTIIPIFGSLIVLIASLYSLYLLYLGAGPAMRVPQDKTLGFTLVVVIAYIIAIGIVTWLLAILLALFFVGAGVAAGTMVR
jgi:hypothetical protein